jgi:hypothetical protein
MHKRGDIVLFKGTRYFVGDLHSDVKSERQFYIPITDDGEVDQTRSVLTMNQEEYETQKNEEMIGLISKSESTRASRAEEKHGVPVESTVPSQKVLRKGSDTLHIIKSFLTKKGGKKTKRKHKRKYRKTKRALDKSARYQF